ncbi:hypothetical protein SNEBB_004007 [Seison nebaliae]|nr:hypothetical protein SNEBB_004007 [Seison nebaliae]
MAEHSFEDDFSDEEIEKTYPFEDRNLMRQIKQFEYLDHTADIQIHSWGRNLKEAFEQVALALFNYVSPNEHVDPIYFKRVIVDDCVDDEFFLYSFLKECLYVNSLAPYFLASHVIIDEFNEESREMSARIIGDWYDPKKHEPGTEIKAITYSAMKINKRSEQTDLFVIVDI